MKVRFVPLHGQDSVSVPDIVDEAGEPVYFGVTDAVRERDLSPDDAAIALTNPNFVDASTGKNPNFAAAEAPAPVTPPFVPAPAQDAATSEV